MRVLVALMASLLLTGCPALLAPQYRPDTSPSRYIRDEGHRNSVIVFVHGVMGGATSTWTNDVTTKSWPELLTQDRLFDGYNIFAYGYDSPLFDKSLSIEDISRNMFVVLSNKGVLEHREILFVVHSMGGLVTRAFLLHEPWVRKQKVAYIHFFASPGSGSLYGNAATAVSMNKQFANMEEMKSGDYLSQAMRAWRETGAAETPTYCSCETRPIALGLPLVVEEGSCALMCDTPTRPLNTDHINIVKPADSSSDPYQDLVAAFRTFRSSSQRFDFAKETMAALQGIKQLLIDHIGQKAAASRLAAPEQIQLDPSRHVSLQLQLFPGDRVTIRDPEARIVGATYVNDSGKTVTEGATFTIKGATGIPVVPDFLPRNTESRLIGLEIERAEPIDAPRQLSTAFEVQQQNTGVGQVGVSIPVKVEPKQLEPLNIPSIKGDYLPLAKSSLSDVLCRDLTAASGFLGCHSLSDGTVVIEPRRYFGSGRWESEDIKRLVRLVADRTGNLGIELDVRVLASASSKPLACSQKDRWPNNYWMVFDKAKRSFALRNTSSDHLGSTANAEVVRCHRHAGSGNREPNQLLSHARAAWAAELLEGGVGGNIKVTEISPLGSAYAISGDAGPDRRLRIELRERSQILPIKSSGK